VAEVIINDANSHLFINPEIDGERKSHGLIPRNFDTHPQGYLACAKPFDLPLIPESEWEQRLAEQVAAKAQLSNIRNTGGPNGGPIPARDQDGVGYCWCHSGTSAVPTSEYWPQRSMSRSNDKPETWANAALHKNLEWMDLAESGSEVKPQLVTCLLLGIPVVTDFSWWSHSVLTIDLVSVNPFRTRILNSWGDSWSENGTGILEGRKAIPDGALAVRVVSPSTA
jgi:hypothetical protein